MSSSSQRQVKTRRVFYIPGYDPIHPRRYRELYRRESASQALTSGYNIDLMRKTGGENYGWQVEASMDGAQIETEFEVLVWSDIVRNSMSESIAGTYLQLVRTAWTYISTGAMWRLMRLRKGPVIAALYPVAMLLAQLALAVLTFFVMASLVGKAFEWLEQMIAGPAGWSRGFEVSILVRVLLGAGAAFFVLRWFKKHDGKFFAYYLMHDYSYSASSRGANPPELETRLAIFKEAIADALAEDVDEVLVVGHSSGAHLGVSILADLFREGGVPEDGPALGFLTLGQVVPMVSFLPDAGRLRGDLQYLSEQSALAWVDVTAPGDGCAFALCDPVSVSGVARDGKIGPLVFSAAFTQTLSPARWRELRWKFFRLHFQYMCAFDQPKDYDYFQITAGPMTLAARYAGRAPSRSRIDRAVSKYTSVTP